MLEVVKQTFAEYGDDKVPLLAAALAYFSVFSLAPLLIILITVLVFFGAGDAQDMILEQVQETVGEDAAGMVESMIENRREEGGGTLATIAGVVVLLFASTTLFAQLKTALNIIWKSEPESETKLGGVKNLVMARVRSLGLIIAIGVLLLLAFLLSTVVSAVINATGDALPGGPGLWLNLNRLVAFAALVGVFALVFKVLPNAEVPWRAVLVGATVTAALFVFGSWAFGIYMSTVAVESAYGAAGSLVVLLLWIYFSAQIVLLGGEFTHVYARRKLDAIARPG
ncbi:MAG: YihY/virulence factor BrkB family protein [Trueperaceae bacterium]|nr:YihY/virulence factor BrkB family protein [Trueperaceae bacterium]